MSLIPSANNLEKYIDLMDLDERSHGFNFPANKKLTTNICG